jgi:glycine/D-amino acid oxidase-like deaminating enzyme
MRRALPIAAAAIGATRASLVHCDDPPDPIVTCSRSERHASLAKGPAASAEPYDVIVVGAGVVGSTVALSLARASGGKTSIAVFERDAPGAGASGLSAGTIWCVGAAADGGERDVTAAVCERTRRIIRGLESETAALDKGAPGADIDIAYDECGALQVLTSAAQLDMAKREVVWAQERGYAMELLTTRAALDAVQPGLARGVMGALYTPLSGHVEPHALAQALAAAAVRAGGVTLVEGRASGEVTAIEPLPPVRWADALERAPAPVPRWAVRTADGRRHEARSVVVANGCGAAALGRSAGLDLRVKPVAGQIWVTEPPPAREGAARGGGSVDAGPDELRRVIFWGESMLAWRTVSTRDDAAGVPEFCTHDARGRRVVRHAYGRCRADGSILFGGDRILVREGALWGGVDDALIAENRALVAEEIFPLAGQRALAGAWSGRMPFSVDGRPIVGELDSVGMPGLWVAIGFGPSGIMKGPGSAEILVEEMLGRPPPACFLRGYGVQGRVRRLSAGAAGCLPPTADTVSAPSADDAAKGAGHGYD